MPGYAKQISREDRWKIVHYIRTLQRAKDAKESDLK
jgi:mono/diheme cytochrome c family protein